MRGERGKKERGKEERGEGSEKREQSEQLLSFASESSIGGTAPVGSLLSAILIVRLYCGIRFRRMSHLVSCAALSGFLTAAS